MPRLTPAQAAAASSSVVGWVEMVRLDFASGVVAAHGGQGSIDYNGDTYLGVGQLGNISDLTESEEFRPQPVSVTLSGIDSALLTPIQTEDYQGRDIDVFVALLDNELNLVGDPIPAWSGFMDVAEISIDNEFAAITMNCESRLTRFNRPVLSRYTNAEQQRRFPGDLFFEYVDQIADRELVWGGVRTGVPTVFNGLPRIDPGLIKAR